MRIYLAGPDVFRKSVQDIEGHFREMKKLCAKHGWVGLSPFDNEILFDKTPEQVSKVIYDNNIKLINESDVVIANISPFRGPSADVGTVFEIGYAKALGKKVICYTDDLNLSYKKRIQINCNIGYLISNKYPIIEDFNLTDNLMVVHGSDKIFRTFEECLNFLSLEVESIEKKVA